jgi:hypothetical protein
VVAGYGIKVHLDAMASPDHHIATFRSHSRTFRQVGAGPG